MTRLPQDRNDALATRRLHRSVPALRRELANGKTIRRAFPQTRAGRTAYRQALKAGWSP